MRGTAQQIVLLAARTATTATSGNRPCLSFSIQCTGLFGSQATVRKRVRGWELTYSTCQKLCHAVCFAEQSCKGSYSCKGVLI